MFDIEEAILNGRIVRTHKRDVRGTKYTIEGLALDAVTVVGVVGRFHATDRFLIITVYDVTLRNLRTAICASIVRGLSGRRRSVKKLLSTRKALSFLRELRLVFATLVE